MSKDGLRFLGDEVRDCTCDLLDKSLSAFNYIQYMFDRTNRMFRYSGLPDTMPDFLVEYMLQIFGSIAVAKYDDELYAFRCNFGGPPDPYYRPTQAVIANPALGISNTYRIANNLPPYDKTLWSTMPECVRVLNDTQIQGLFPLFSRYATQMVENDISIRSAQINSRQQSVIVADSGPEIESAESYMKSLEAGLLASIQKRPFVEGVRVNNVQVGSSNLIIQLIELQQYLKASWYNEIGLNSNFNMKRQYMSEEEVNSSADIMLPLVDNMFECRKRFFDDVNRIFDTNISVEKDSAWEKKQIQSNLSVMGSTVESGELEEVQSTVIDELDESGELEEVQSTVLDESDEASQTEPDDSDSLESGELKDINDKLDEILDILEEDINDTEE